MYWFLYPSYFVLLALGSHDNDVDLSSGSLLVICCGLGPPKRRVDEATVLLFGCLYLNIKKIYVVCVCVKYLQVIESVVTALET